MLLGGYRDGGSVVRWLWPEAGVSRAVPGGPCPAWVGAAGWSPAGLGAVGCPALVAARAPRGKGAVERGRRSICHAAPTSGVEAFGAWAHSVSAPSVWSSTALEASGAGQCLTPFVLKSRHPLQAFMPNISGLKVPECYGYCWACSAAISRLVSQHNRD